MRRLLVWLFFLLAVSAFADDLEIRFPVYAGDPYACNSVTQGFGYMNGTSHIAYVCNATSWTTLFATVSGSGTLNTLPKWTPSGSVLGNSLVTDDGTTITLNTATTARASAVSNGSTGFLNVVGTLPSSRSAETHALNFDITTAGSSSFTIVGLSAVLEAGYTGSSLTVGADGVNLISGSTGNNFGLFGYSDTTRNSALNAGVVGQARNGGTTAVAIGTLGQPAGIGSTIMVGAAGIADSGTRRIGGYFGLGTSLASTQFPDTVALLADNDAVGAPIALFRDNGTVTLEVADGGSVVLGASGGLASPVGRTLRSEGSRSGTDSNVGGSNLTLSAAAGTGTGTASSLSLQSPALVASGTGAQTLTTRATADSVGLVVPAGQWFRAPSSTSMLASDYTNATATMSNTALSITVLAGRSYSFKLVLFLNDSTAADGSKFDFDGGGATATNFRAHCTQFDTALLLSTQTTALATDVAQATVTGDALLECYGTFVVNAAGTFIVRGAQNAHTIGTLTVYKGSHLWMQDMGS